MNTQYIQVLSVLLLLLVILQVLKTDVDWLHQQINN